VCSWIWGGAHRAKFESLLSPEVVPSFRHKYDIISSGEHVERSPGGGIEALFNGIPDGHNAG
jgi:hypothetical protein